MQERAPSIPSPQQQGIWGELAEPFCSQFTSRVLPLRTLRAILRKEISYCESHFLAPLGPFPREPGGEAERILWPQSADSAGKLTFTTSRLELTRPRGSVCGCGSVLFGGPSIGKLGVLQDAGS